MRGFVKMMQAQTLLHNKFVLVLGSSVQRSMYKDLVRLLQTDNFLTLSQLKSKGEFSFESDRLVEGGRLGLMSNGVDYREVRQYHSDHHLLRFYFITRVYSPYMQSILEDLRQGLKPDLIIVNSCVWDITRYGLNCLENYKQNLHRFFEQIKSVVCQDCLIIWTLAMPLAKQIRGGFLVPEVSHMGPSLCSDIIEANFFGGSLADSYGLDTLDLHFHFRLSLQHRMPDGVHWDALAHRTISSLLLQHTAQAWGVHMGDACSKPALLPPLPPPPPPGFKKRRRRARVKPFPPPPPPLMSAEAGPSPWCSPLRSSDGSFWGPRQSCPGPGRRTPPFPHPRLPPPEGMMPPHHPPFRCPPPDRASGGWSNWSGGVRVRWRRPRQRMHPYYCPEPRPPTWGW